MLRFTGALATFVVRFRWLVISVSAVVVLAALGAASRIVFSFDFKQFFPVGDADVERYDAFTAQFGADDRFLVVALTAPDVFTTARLERIRALTAAIEALPGVQRVLSLTNAPHLSGSAGTIEVAPYVSDPAPADAAGLATLRAAVLADKLFASSYVAADGTAAALLVEVADAVNSTEGREPVLAALRGVLGTIAAADFEWRLGGIPAARNDYVTLLTRETLRMFAFSGVIILFVLFFTFRTLAGVVLPLLMCIIAVILTTALMVLTGTAVSILGSIIPVILMVIGVSDSIHLLSRYYEELAAGRTKEEALRVTVTHLAVACFLTASCNAVGFAALVTTSLVMLREYGLFTAIGVLVAYVVTIFLLPALLAVLPAPRKIASAPNDGGWLSRRLEGFSILAGARPGRVVAAFLVLGAACGTAMFGVRREARLFDDLHGDHPIIRTNDLLEEKLGGILPVEIAFDTGVPEGMSDPEALAAAARTVAWLRARSEVAHVLSVSDLLATANEVFHDGDKAWNKVPHTRPLAAQLIEAVTGSGDAALDELFDPARRHVRVSARVRDLGSTKLKAFFADLDVFLNGAACSPTAAPGLCPPLVTGTTLIATKVNDYLIDQTFGSFLQAFLFVTVMLWLMLRNWKLALLALPPNLLPMAATLAIMFAFDIPLKPSTSIIFSIAFGIAVDDTMHFMARLQEEQAAGVSLRAAVRRTIHGEGRAMIFCTVVLCTGFLPGLSSELSSNQLFSALTIATLAIAVFGDLLMTPALVILLEKWLRPGTAKAGAPGTSSSATTDAPPPEREGA